jgi:Exostosin family
MKPGLYLLLFLLLTVYRVVQMSVLLTRQAVLDANGMMTTMTMTMKMAGSGSVGIGSDPPRPFPQQPSTTRGHGTSNNSRLRTSSSLPSSSAAAAADALPSECRRNDGSTTIDEHLPKLNDMTVRLTPCLPRNYVVTATATSTQQQQQRPNNKKATIKTKIWLTSFGWNHPNRTLGITYPRSQRTRELLQAIVDHPDFDPNGWGDYHNPIKRGSSSDNSTIDDTDVQHLVFLDVETCHEGNYPHYGRHDRNQDNDGGRPSEPHRWNLKKCYTADNCSAVQSALASPLFSSKENNNAKLVYLDCKGNGVTEAERNVSSHIAFASLSSHGSQLDPRKGDQGLPPPVDAAKFQLTPRELQQVDECDESHRQYLLSFVGALRRDSPRDKLVSLHNDNTRGEGGGNFTTRGQQQQHRQPQRPIFAMSKADFAAHQQQQQQGSDGTTYESLLRHSLFAAAPRGTNLFSYRFAEAIALGAIPVVHSDGWVLPFSDRVVDWSECAVIIPERRLHDTPRILRAISDERRCQMRKACVNIYQRYMSSPSGTVQGILEGLVPISEKP